MITHALNGHGHHDEMDMKHGIDCGWLQGLGRIQILDLPTIADMQNDKDVLKKTQCLGLSQSALRGTKGLSSL